MHAIEVGVAGEFLNVTVIQQAAINCQDRAFDAESTRRWACATEIIECSGSTSVDVPTSQ